MKYLFYTDSQSAWQGFMSTAQNAQTSIYIEMYIFVDDAPEIKNLIDILATKAESGVAVRIVLDAFGSKELSSNAVDLLKKAGVEILFFRKWFRRLHRKILIVDEKIGFVGGVNIHKSARKWADLLVRVEGPIVHSLIHSFKKVYRACGGTDAHILTYRKKAILGGTRIWFLEHLPSIRHPRLKDAYKQAMLGAEHQVIISTPYFLPHRWLKKLLLETKNRGIDVKIFVPKDTDLSFITKANYTYMRVLGRRGITFYIMPKMNHSKLLLVDDKLALVGSQNIDALSFDYNAEAGLFFSDANMIKDLKAIISTWEKESTLFDPYHRITLIDRAFSYFVKLIQGFL